MSRLHPGIPGAATVVLFCASLALGQTSETGQGLILRSTGTVDGSTVTLSQNGYLGTYLEVPAGGATVNFTVNANAVAGAGNAPNMNLVVADSKFGFSVSSTSATDYTTGDITLAEGKYVVRAERDFIGNSAGPVNNLTIGNLSVNTVSGSSATFSNTNTSANALDASNTYIQNFRKGNVTINIPGISSGTQVDVQLKRHAFNFGTAVPGVTSTQVNNYLGDPNTGTTAQQQQKSNYQQHLVENFNSVVPENAGKWASNESTRDTVTMDNIDTILNFAEDNNMRARMHNLIWGDNSFNGQQPSWVLNNNAAPNNGLLDKAALGDAAAEAELREEISERIDDYVGTGSASDRSHKYVEIDIFNESYHTGSNAGAGFERNYWNAYEPEGIADIYKEVQNAIAASGSGAKVFVNEFSILDNGSYANYYAQHIETLRNAGIAEGFGDVVDGIGVQYYIGTGHNPATVIRNLQNLSVQGLPMSLTEFGVNSSVSDAQAALILEESLQLVFGNPDATGFLMWGFHAENGGGNLFQSGAALFEVDTDDWTNWLITEAGEIWQDLLGIQDWDSDPTNAWDTELSDFVDLDGNIQFDAFWGDYEFVINGQTFWLTLDKGTNEYILVVPEPASLIGLVFAALCLQRRRLRR